MYRSSLLSIGVALLALGCGGGTEPAPVITLSLVEGSGQSGLSLDTLSDMVVVRATDGEGSGVQGIALDWSAGSTDQGGTLVPVSAVTDAAGYARAHWVLGIGSGTQHALVRVRGSQMTAAVEAEALPGLQAVTLMKQTLATHTCAADAEGATWCWGENRTGQLGNGTWTDFVSTFVSTPQRVVGTARFVALSGMESSSCGLTGAGELWCWGVTEGWLERVGSFAVGTPFRFAPELAFKSVRMADNLVCAVALDGRGYCWGRGVIGNGIADRRHTELTPALVSADLRWQDITPADHQNTYGVTETLEIYSWGNEGGGLTGATNQDFYGIDADGYLAVPTLTPVVSGLTGIAADNESRCGLQNGTAICWGLIAVSDPLAVAGDAFVQLAAGRETFYALTASGRVYWWGRIPGAYTGVTHTTPVALAGAGPWTTVGIGPSAEPCAILAADETVYCWPNHLDALSIANALPRPVPPPAGP